MSRFEAMCDLLALLRKVHPKLSGRIKLLFHTDNYDHLVELCNGR